MLLYIGMHAPAPEYFALKIIMRQFHTTVLILSAIYGNFSAAEQ
jgi:hypothetical protein